ncbi:DNA mismatch repair protein MutL [Encephalitozoon intestinalis ATCC 50506]|uniref:DNA mismatch repair protein MutL n=1 Tax=Encephalitozoon intestinalis (strain ATCC 50506) TaxID=876142 RepID=E0S9Z2_ENCIT|nr:DNA mismatch repair protein MutL [Encephalitozoon intestinalis ATCC 50506]ADM12614.1 DNA mismatch repair protein MutL [Encephalitozoon intestinalis ATCC 50506]UTX46473.1 DNA mismatch repair protein Mlh1 [Encephalitozoon intestinalis]
MIKRLPEDIGRRIKAQRSIPNTYIVVKELVENSIDSECTWIRIQVDDSIVVEDNGCGISDLRDVGVEGSTSKESMAYYVLGCVDRVEKPSYGFRGQALSSLSEVCDLEIISRSEHPFGLKKDFSTGIVSRCAREKGTTVRVRNLFKNCPLRRSASESRLKKDLGRICALIESYRCTNKINFTLFHKRKVLLSCGGYETPREYFESNYPSFVGKYMELCNGQVEFFMLPASVREPKQLMFLERRPISNKRISAAIKNEFNLYSEGIPTFVLVIKGYGDVNVSTDKSEVIFSDEGGILSLLKSEIGRFFSSEVHMHSRSIPKTLGSYSPARNETEDNSGEGFMGSNFSGTAVHHPAVRLSRVAPSLGKRERKQNEMTEENEERSKDSSSVEEPSSGIGSLDNTEVKPSSSNLSEELEPPLEEKQQEEIYENEGHLATGAYSFFKYDELVHPKISFSKSDFNRLEIIGQFNNGFIIAKLEKNEKTYLIAVDQHAADEIRNFENIKKTFYLKKQSVIVPVKLDLTPIEEMIVNENSEVFEKNGFVVKNGMLETIPVYRNQVFGIKEFRELLEDVKNEEYEFKKIRSIIASKACRTSVMIGDALSAADMKRIVRSLGVLDRPWKCPHGRPTFMILNEAEI